jgi:hypothetical protein
MIATFLCKTERYLTILQSCCFRLAGCLKLGLAETGCGGADRLHLAKGSDKCCALVNTIMQGCINFPKHLGKHPKFYVPPYKTELPGRPGDLDLCTSAAMNLRIPQMLKTS